MENVWNKFLLSPLEMARFVDELDSPWVGVYFDAGNILSYGFPQHWIEILGPRIKKVHVKDFKTQIGSIQGFANPLQGDVPWAAVRAALDGIGYGGLRHGGSGRLRRRARTRPAPHRRVPAPRPRLKGSGGMRRSELDGLLRSETFWWAVGIEDSFLPAPHPRTGRTLDEYEVDGPLRPLARGH